MDNYGIDSAKRFLNGNLEKPEDEYQYFGGQGSSSLQGKSMNSVIERNQGDYVKETKEDKGDM